MTTVSGVNSATNTAAAASSTSSSTAATATVDYNQFLQLLVAELQNQDPTQPTDPTQYMSQLASFSSVEQQIQTNTLLTSTAITQAESMIGQTITSADGTQSGTVASITINGNSASTANLTNGSQISLGTGVTIGS